MSLFKNFLSQIGRRFGSAPQGTFRRSARNFLLLMTVLPFLACLSLQRAVTVHTIGDSTMADKKAEVYPETGWGQALPAFFNRKVTVRNYAVNGRSTKSFIAEGRWQTVLDNLKPGDYVFIQFGHNDQKIQDPVRYATPFDGYQRNLERFVHEAREKQAIPILFTPIVRRKFDPSGKLIDTHGDYPAAVKQVAAGMQVPLIDLQQKTAELVQSLGDEPSKKIYLWTGPTEKFPKERNDDTHLSVEGAAAVARLAVAELQRQKLPLAKYVIKKKVTHHLKDHIQNK